MGNTTKGLDLGETIRNGKPEVRGFESKALSYNHQSYFTVLNNYQGTSMYLDVLKIVKRKVKKLNKLIN